MKTLIIMLLLVASINTAKSRMDLQYDKKQNTGDDQQSADDSQTQQPDNASPQSTSQDTSQQNESKDPTEDDSKQEKEEKQVGFLGLLEELNPFNKIDVNENRDHQIIQAGRSCQSLKSDEGQTRCEEGSVCKKYCVKGREGSKGGCQKWCVKKNGEKCTEDLQCMTEFCNDETKICQDRGIDGYRCDRDTQCQSYICDDDGFCSDKPEIKSPATFTSEDNSGKKCQAEILIPEEKGVLGPCITENDSDANCPNANQFICMEGRCKIKAKQWCYPGNEQLSCLNVCEKNTQCTKLVIKKTQYIKNKADPNYESMLYENIDMMKNSYKKQWRAMRFSGFFTELYKLIRFRNSELQIYQKTADGASHITAYQCFKVPGTDNGISECEDGKNTLTQNCEGGKVVGLANDSACSQGFQCQSGSCDSEKNVCAEPLADGEKCEDSSNCKSKICKVDIVPPNQSIKEIPSGYIKKCRPEGSLRINDECREDSNCGTHNGIKMKCLESDPIIRSTEEQLGFSSLSAFKHLRKAIIEENYPNGDGLAKVQGQIKYEVDKRPPWTKEQLFDDFHNGIIFKCKIPHNERCKADYECPKLNVCQKNSCRGLDNAPCSSTTMCDVTRRLYCQFNTNEDDVNYGRMLCIKKTRAMLFKKRFKAQKTNKNQQNITRLQRKNKQQRIMYRK